MTEVNTFTLCIYIVTKWGKKVFEIFQIKPNTRVFIDHVAALYKPGDIVDTQKWRPSVTLIVDRVT